jgi:anthranilate phosphoribosyltransferase
MKNVAPIRQELGVKTFFNMLGPMVNPSFPKNQLVGVFSLELARLYGYLYQKTDKHFVILHSLDGYDEISLTGGFKMITDKEEQILNPVDLGMYQVAQKELSGGDSIEASARIFLDILKGKGTQAQSNAVIANAGMAIYCGKQLATVADGIEEARASLYSGRALDKFKKLVQ